MNTLELAKYHPDAFAALPECYQADSCLVFWTQAYRLLCKPSLGQAFALGHWAMVWDPLLKDWFLSS